MKEDVTQVKILQQIEALSIMRNGNPSLLEIGYKHLGIGKVSNNIVHC